MLVTIEVINKGTLNLLQSLEGMGLIQVKTSISQDSEETSQPLPENKQTWRWLYGCCKNSPQGSVDEFLARCREDKEYELAIEKREQEERARRASTKLPS